GSDPDSMAGVISHEIAHVSLGHLTANHSAENELRAAGAAVDIFFDLKKAQSANSGNVPPGLRAINFDERFLELLFQLQKLKFGRDDELAADYRGIQLMTAAGINPVGALNFMRSSLATIGNVGGFLTDHPLTSDRIEQFNQYLAQS